MGRYSGGGKTTTGEVLSLDVRRLARERYFAGGTCSGLWRWTSGASAAFTATPDALALRYSTRDPWTDERRDHAPSVPVEWTLCPFGGRRPWFLCPRCGRRCAVVYLRRSTACRRCHGLAYPCQREDASLRAHRRGRKLMERLGVTRQDAWDLALQPRYAPKPPRMRWTTYERIVAAAEDAEEARVGELMRGLARFLR